MQETGPGSGTLEQLATSRAADALMVALQGMYRAYQKISIYPSGHPAVPEAVELATRGFEQALAERALVTVRVARDHLIGDDPRIAEAGGLLRAAATLLHELDVAALEFHTGLTVLELETFIHSLDRARKNRLRGEGLARALAADHVDHIRVHPIDYSLLSFADGAEEERRDAPDGRDLWGFVSRALTDRSPAGARSVEQVAAEVTERIRSHEGTGIGSLRRELHGMVSQVQRLQPDQRVTLRQRLAALLAALNPGLRHDLLRVSPTGPGGSMALLAELCDELPVTDLVEALKEVDRGGGRPPDELLILLNSLVRISQHRPPVASFLDETLRRWGIPREVLGWDPVDLRGALEEVFQRRSETEFNPGTYQALLETLSRKNLAGRGQESTALYGELTDEEGIRTHAAEIAVELLGRSDGDEQRPQLYAYVGAATNLMLEQGKLATVNSAALAARAHTLLKSEREETRRAAQGFLTDFTDSARIERILQQVQRDETLLPDGIDLLGLGGAPAIDRVLDALDAEAPAGLAEAFSGFLTRRDTTQIAEVVRERSKRGWSELRPLFPILTRLQPAHGLPMFEQLFTHTEQRVRREALLALCDMDERPAGRQGYLRRGLADPSAGVVNTALKRLADTESPEVIALLGDYAEGRLGSPGLDAEHCQRAAGLLADRGEAGQERLCEALHRLSKSARPARARRARLLADLLRSRPLTPKTREALRVFSLSPARMITFLVRGDARAPGGGS